MIRTLVNSNSPEDPKAVHELQDGIKVAANSDNPFEATDYDKASYKAVLDGSYVFPSVEAVAKEVCEPG